MLWQRIYAVGHEELDIEHERLLGIINEICVAEFRKSAPQQLISLLNSLYLAATEHFRHENSLMRDIIAGAYLPRASHEKMSEAIINEHCAEHARALIELEDMLHSFVSNQDTVMAKSLRDWFVDHATQHDAHLRAFFQSQ